ncbi:alternative ribosome rescue aminoacyl-tRNA hydrolase ArfB [Catenulispora yoronensis]|uniref:Alternative ribosome rescue aminoacyl-tRNA hydrolase ArfB n=1 Tax=Catenulispora yoronensis TaxID=450799 RepID=A0ABN2V3D5_9ACTN
MADETTTGVNGPLTVRYLAVPPSARTPRVFTELTIPAAELFWRFSRSAGPGGQGVNTTDSRAELSFDVAESDAIAPWLKTRALERLAGRLVNGVLTVTSSEQRSQLQNREAARDRLAFTLAEALAPPPPPRREKKTPAGVTRRRLENKARRGQVKQMRRRVDDY